MKMLRRIKKFGRCRVPKHGSTCEPSREIQTQPITRTEDKRTWKKELNLELNSCPHCGSQNPGGHNWAKGLDGGWFHECWDCENVFVTDNKLKSKL